MSEFTASFENMGDYAGFSSLHGNTAQPKFDLGRMFGDQNRTLSRLASNILNSSGRATPNNTNSQRNGAVNNLSGNRAEITSLKELNASSHEQVNALVTVYRYLQTSNNQFKDAFESIRETNQHLIDEVKKLNSHGNEEEGGGGSLLNSAFNRMQNSGGFGGATRAATREAETLGRTGFISRATRGLGRAARFGGRVLSHVAAPLALLDAGSSLSGLTETRNTPLLGNESTGGILGSRLSNYASLALDGATVGGTAGAAFAGVGAIPGAALGAAAGIGSGLLADFGPDIGKLTHQAADAAKEGLTHLWQSVTKFNTKAFNDIEAYLPSSNQINSMLSSVGTTLSNFGEKLATTISDLVKSALDYIWQKIPSWGDIQHRLGFGGNEAPSGNSGGGGGNNGAAGSSPNGSGGMTTGGTSNNTDSDTGGNTGSSQGGNNTNRQSSDNNMSQGIYTANSAGALAGTIASGESRGQTGIYNSGAGNKYRVGHFDADNTSLEEVMRRQSLGQTDPNRIFAAGTYQVIPETLRGAVSALKLDPHTTMFNQETQNRIFADYLSTQKRPEIAAYIRGNGSLDAAHSGVASEWASVAYHGRGKYDHDGVNHSTISDEKIRGQLQQARQTYQNLRNQGVDEQTAYRQAVLGISDDKKNNTATANNNDPTASRAQQQNPEATAANTDRSTPPADRKTDDDSANNNSDANTDPNNPNSNTNPDNNVQAANVGPVQRFGLPMHDDPSTWPGAKPNDSHPINTASANVADGVSRIAGNMPSNQDTPTIQRITDIPTSRTTILPDPQNPIPDDGNDYISSNSDNNTSKTTNQNSNNNRTNMMPNNTPNNMQSNSSKDFDGGGFGIDSIPMYISSAGMVMYNGGATA